MTNKQVFIKNGYEKLKNKDQLDYLYLLSKKLINQAEEINEPVFGLSPGIINSALKQFFIQRILHVTFNENILIAFGRNKKLKFGLPTSWLIYLEQNEGLKSISYLNKLRWKAKIFYWYFAGIYFMIKYFLILIKRFKTTYQNSSYVYFDNLNELNFPEKFSESKTIVNWYLRRENPNRFNEIIHSVKSIKKFEQNGKIITYSSLPFNLRINIGVLLSYLREMVRITIVTFFKLLLGDSIQALLLKEYPLLYLSRLAKKEDFAKDYLFHNSTAIYKPLWTNIAETNQSNIILYFYSANTRMVNIDDKDHTLFGHKEFMTWRKYYVWNQYQKKHIEGMIPNAEVIVVGPIWFQASNIKLENITESNKKIISIFDVQPYNFEHYRILGMPNEYYTFQTINSFHQDIFDLFSSKQDYLIVLKRKRDTTMLDDQYLEKIDSIYNQLPFMQIDPAVDAGSLLQFSYASIHLPSTSTAFISKSLGIESIYYDATLKIKKNDQSLAGVNLIQGKKELNEWLNDIESYE